MSLILYLTVVGLIVRRWTAITLAVAPFAVPASIALGHNGLFTAAVIGLSLLYFEQRPWRGGMALGPLTYKPQFGLLFPLALLASRNWRALLGAAGSSAILGSAAAIAFGFRTWPSFFDIAVRAQRELQPGAGGRTEAAVDLRRGALAGGRNLAAHLAAAGIVASAVSAVWARPIFSC